MQSNTSDQLSSQYIDTLFKANNYGLIEIENLIRNQKNLSDLQMRFLPYLYEKFSKEKLDLEFFKNDYDRTLINHSETIKELSALTDNLNDLKIDYVLTKGVAVTLAVFPRPIRKFGDVDILIKAKNLKEFMRVTRFLGYQSKYPIKCPKFVKQEIVGEIALIKPQCLELDVHVINFFSSNTLKAIMHSERKTLKINERLFNVPSPELMICHSLEHGLKKVANSDSLQTSIDLKILENIVNYRTLGLHLKSQRLFFAFNKLLRHPGYSDLITRSGLYLYIEEKIFKIRAMIKILFKNAYSLPIYISKRKTLSQLLCISKGNHGLKLRYLIWLAFGMNSKLERILGPFLRSPIGKIEKQTLQICYSEANAIGYTSLKHSNLTSDYRFLFKLNPNLTRVNILLSDKNLQGCGFLVFIDGKLYGTTNPTINNYEIRIDNPGEQHEVSLRFPKHSCPKCLTDLNELQITFISNNQKPT